MLGGALSDSPSSPQFETETALYELKLEIEGEYDPKTRHCRRVTRIYVTVYMRGECEEPLLKRTMQFVPPMSKQIAELVGAIRSIDGFNESDRVYVPPASYAILMHTMHCGLRWLGPVFVFDAVQHVAVPQKRTTQELVKSITLDEATHKNFDDQFERELAEDEARRSKPKLRAIGDKR